MTIAKVCHRIGHISELGARYPAFMQFEHASVRGPGLRWVNSDTGAASNHAQVAFFGKSGYGKSSTVNALFGGDILQTSAVTACTRQCDTLDFELAPDNYLALADFPGIGESGYQDQSYLRMYAQFFLASTVVVYLLRADLRDFTIDLNAYKTVFPTSRERSKVLFALNCCDKIEPTSRSAASAPSPEQLHNIKLKLATVRDILKPAHAIVPYSAATGWNLDLLAQQIAHFVARSGHVHRPAP